MTSNYQHFPLSLIKNDKIKISANSNLLNLLPENFNYFLENPREIVPENKNKIKGSGRLRLKRPKKKQKNKLT